MIIEVLAVPGPPTKSVFLCEGSFLSLDLIRGRLAIFSIMYCVLVDSTVGISNYENVIFLGGSHLSDFHNYQSKVFSHT